LERYLVVMGRNKLGERSWTGEEGCDYFSGSSMVYRQINGAPVRVVQFTGNVSMD
jgi:hypothetical protein